MSYNEYSSYSLDPLNRSRFYGIYQGTVLDNTDFENKKRLTVIVPQVTGSDSLTLVRPSAPSGVLNSIQIPEVGAYVWVMFESGDPNYPVWMSSTETYVNVDGTLGYYGAFSDYTDQYAGGSTTLGGAAANTAAPLVFGQTDESNGVSITNNGSGKKTRITFAHVGTYNLQFSIQLENNGTAPHDVFIWLKKNGTDIAGSTGNVGIPARKNPGDPFHTIYGWNFVFTTTSVNDYYEFYWSTTSTEVSIQYYSQADNGSPTKPSTASLVLTATEVMNTQVGPAGPGVPVGGTAGQVLAKIDGTNYNTQWVTSSGSSGVSSVDGLTGSVTLSGTYLTQTNAASTYEPKITAGTTAQYFRGDKSLATFPTALSSFSNDTNFITSSALSPYLTSSTASSTYAPISSPSLTGTPLTTTAAVDTNTTQIASTAFVLSQAASATPVMDGTAAVGTSTRYARADHVHGSDTTKANTNQTMYIGTTSVAINRTSASQSLTGITSIDGTATGISGSQTANTVLAAPNGSSGTASFRALVAADIPSLDAGKITSGVIGNTIAAAPALFYTNYSDISAGTVASAVAIPMFNKSVALAASTIYEIDLSWLITLTTGTTVNTPRLWWNYSGTVDATNPINWEARYTQVSGSTPFSTAETAGNTNQVYPVTAVRLGTTTSPLSAGPGYLASTSYVSKIVGKAIIRTSTAGNLSFNIQAGVTAGNPGYTAFNTKAGSFMRVTPMGTNSGADFSIGIWA